MSKKVMRNKEKIGQKMGPLCTSLAAANRDRKILALFKSMAKIQLTR